MDNIDSIALAGRWECFAQCQKRTQTLKPFFEQYVLHPDIRRAVDLGAGIGCEAAWMARRFKSFVANEIDPVFRQALLQVRRRCGVEFEITEKNWLSLRDAGLGIFDLGILLGNSLCLLQDELAINSALENFRAILNLGGRFVVDQRNFDYMLDERHSIFASGFRYTAQVMYCGTAIIGKPVAIDDSRVLFGYFDALSNKQIGQLEFLPTRRQRLCELLNRAGLVVDQVYSDLCPGVDGTADFFSYVCHAE
jgi:SAM-dependent methyltransferase